jgi:hypothetical protein
LTTADKAVSVDTSKPGFIWGIFQNENAHLTPGLTVQEYLAECELALAGQLPEVGGGFLFNLADPSKQGPWMQDGVPEGALLKYEIPTVINLNKVADGVSPNPTPPVLVNAPVAADQMPGLPGLNGSSAGIDVEIRTFVELPAGVTRLGIACQEYFRIQGGMINNPTNGAVLVGEGVGHNAQLTPYIFNVVAETAGVYPLRIIYQDLNSGPAPAPGSITLYTIKANGDSVLLGDDANGGLKAYRVGVVPGRGFRVGYQVTGGQFKINWTEPGTVLQESTNLVNWLDLPAATSPYGPPAGRRSVFFRLKK